MGEPQLSTSSVLRVGAGVVEIDELLELVAGWLPQQRWFPARTEAVRLRLVDLVSWETDESGTSVHVLVVTADGSPTGSAAAQVPVVLRTGPAEVPTTSRGLGHVPVRDERGGATQETALVTDGPGDPAYLRAWLDRAVPEPDVAGHVRAGLEARACRPITGEQSNSSVILPSSAPDAPSGILKVFRSLTPGANPDVDVPRALTAAGFRGVPRVLAWQDGERPGGHLAVLSAFVPDAADGFQLACDLAATGEDFAPLAGELGATVASLHDALVHAFGTTQSDGAGDGVADALARRLAWATARVPALADVAPAVTRLVERLAALPQALRVQRIHGDLHLGQVLRAPSGWFVMDFEGEPLVPVDQRTRPDLALRDVAGLLRSIDYAAARGGGDARWAHGARHALLTAYLEGRESDVDAGAQTLVLGALELDKALYEVVYETENRPTWAQIPWTAVRRLLDELGGSASKVSAPD